MDGRLRLLLVLAVLAAGAGAPPAAVVWKPLQNGVELAVLAEPAGPLYAVRVDPSLAKLAAGIATAGPYAAGGGVVQTAAQWCRTAHFSVAINLGMYEADHRTHTGYLRDGTHVNNASMNEYRSLLALRPVKPRGAPVLWFDLASAAMPPATRDYRLVVQNLRLIAADAQNVWAASDRKWSEAALAIDHRGRLLFLFSRAPYTMRDFNALVLRSPLDVRQAMHVEGGPEASLSIHVGGVDLDLCGSYETGFIENDSNRAQWALPNVLGVQAEEKK